MRASLSVIQPRRSGPSFLTDAAKLAWVVSSVDFPVRMYGVNAQAREALDPFEFATVGNPAHNVLAREWVFEQDRRHGTRITA